MILATITGNGQTFNVCDKASKKAGNNGYNDGSTFYYPAILNQPTFSLGGNSIIEPKNITLRLDRSIVSALGSAEITITIYLWNENEGSSKFLFMNGTGQRATYNSLEYVYDIEPDKFGLDEDMLSAAPDMKQVSLLLNGAHTAGDTTIDVLSNAVTNAQSFLPSSGTLWISGDTYTYNSVSGDTITLSTGLTRNYADKCLILDNVTSSDERVYPMYFGFLKYAIPLQLAVSCLSGCGGSFYIDGEVKDAYDESSDINYTQVEGNLTKDGSAVKFKLTADVDATSGADGTASGVTEYVGANKVIRLATAPSAIDYDLISGDIWVDTSVSGANIRKEWNGSAWVASFDDRSDKGFNTSGEVVQIVKGSNLPTTGQGSGLNLTGSHMGYYNGSTWNAVIENNGEFYFGDGGSTIGTDKFIKYESGNFIISTSQFQVDASGNASFSGDVIGANIYEVNSDSKNYVRNFSRFIDAYSTGSTWYFKWEIYAYNATTSSSIYRAYDANMFYFMAYGEQMGSPFTYYTQSTSSPLTLQTTTTVHSLGYGTLSSLPTNERVTVTWKRGSTTIESDTFLNQATYPIQMTFTNFPDVYVDISGTTFVVYMEGSGLFNFSGNGDLRLEVDIIDNDTSLSAISTIATNKFIINYTSAVN